MRKAKFGDVYYHTNWACYYLCVSADGINKVVAPVFSGHKVNTNLCLVLFQPKKVKLCSVTNDGSSDSIFHNSDAINASLASGKLVFVMNINDILKKVAKLKSWELRNDP